MNITVLFSLPTSRVGQSAFQAAEADTRITAELIAASLKKSGFGVSVIPVAENNLNVIDRIKSDLVFNLIEWTGNDLPLALDAWERLDHTGVPYTGASRRNWEITTDKILMKQELDRHGLANAAWQVFYTGEEKISGNIKLPLLLKLSREHCGIGMEPESLIQKKQDIIARVKKRIAAFNQPVIAEKYISGREFEVGLVEVDGRITVLPPIENIYRTDSPTQFLTYDGRWQDNAKDYVKYQINIAKLEYRTMLKIRRLCRQVFRKLDFHDYARFDIRLDQNGDPVMLDANSNPGIDDSAENGLPVGFHAIGWTFDRFILQVIKSASRRNRSAAGKTRQIGSRIGQHK